MSLLETGFGKSGWSAYPSRRTTADRLLVVNGHPDPRPERFCAALSQAYLAGAIASGRGVDSVALGAVFRADGQNDAAELKQALDLMRQRPRLIVIFPLWLDKPPEIVTRFFEHASRGKNDDREDRHAHLLVTMSLPAFAHRSIVREQGATHPTAQITSLPGLVIDALNFVGSVDVLSRAQREEWLHRIRRLGSGKV